MKATQAMYWIGRDNPRQPPALAVQMYNDNSAPIALRELVKDSFVDACEPERRACQPIRWHMTKTAQIFCASVSIGPAPLSAPSPLARVFERDAPAATAGARRGDFLGQPPRNLPSEMGYGRGVAT
jgi:hypothetical protein